MLAIKGLKFIQRTLSMFLLAAFIWTIGLPYLSVEAKPITENNRTIKELNKVGNRPYGESGNIPIIQADKSNDVSPATIKRIKNKAEDLVGSRPIGDTGLKNIRKLGENIPETINQNARQRFGKTPKQMGKDIQRNVKRTVKDITD